HFVLGREEVENDHQSAGRPFAGETHAPIERDLSLVAPRPGFHHLDIRRLLLPLADGGGAQGQDDRRQKKEPHRRQFSRAAASSTASPKPRHSGLLQKTIYSSNVF